MTAAATFPCMLPRIWSVTSLASSPRPAPSAVTPAASAVANAENNLGLDPEKLYVSETYADPGPILKRGMPRAQGRMYRINKRTSHITIVVAEKE